MAADTKVIATQVRVAVEKALSSNAVIGPMLKGSKNGATSHSKRVTNDGRAGAPFLDDRPASLQDWARRAKAEAEGDFERALTLFVSWARADEQLYRELTDTEVAGRCRQLLTRLEVADRLSVEAYGGGSISRQTLNGQDDAALFREAALLAYCLPGSHRAIGKATLVDLATAREYCRKRVVAYRRDLILIDKVASRVKKGQLVEDVLTDVELHALLTEAVEEAKA